jgi:hypothetical protein
VKHSKLLQDIIYEDPEEETPTIEIRFGGEAGANVPMNERLHAVLIRYLDCLDKPSEKNSLADLSLLFAPLTNIEVYQYFVKVLAFLQIEFKLVYEFLNKQLEAVKNEEAFPNVKMEILDEFDKLKILDFTANQAYPILVKSNEELLARFHDNGMLTAELNGILQISRDKFFQIICGVPSLVFNETPPEVMTFLFDQRVAEKSHTKLLSFLYNEGVKPLINFDVPHILLEFLKIQMDLVVTNLSDCGKTNEAQFGIEHYRPSVRNTTCAITGAPLPIVGSKGLIQNPRGPTTATLIESLDYNFKVIAAASSKRTTRSTARAVGVLKFDEPFRSEKMFDRSWTDMLFMRITLLAAARSFLLKAREYETHEKLATIKNASNFNQPPFFIVVPWEEDEEVLVKRCRRHPGDEAREVKRPARVHA